MDPRILVISEIFWPEGGGAELATYLVLQLLKREGYNITVVTGTENPRPIKGVSFIYTPLLRYENRILRWIRMLELTQQQTFQNLMQKHDIVYIPLAAYPLIPAAKSRKKKIIVHLHNFMSTRYYGIKYANEPDKLPMFQEFKLAIKHELHVHNSIPRALLLAPSFTLYVLSKHWIQQADAIICGSKRQFEIVKRVMPNIRHKIKIIYNPLPHVNPLPKKLEKPIFLYLGGDSYIKGFHILLKASLKILKRYSDVNFNLVGSFKDTNKLLIEKLNMRFRGAYSLLSRLEHDEVLRLHSSAYALLFPSIVEEPLPYAIIESMLCGTIPIASRVGGVLEIVQGTYAEKMLFPPNDVDRLVERIESILSLSNEQLTSIGEHIREEILKKFNEKATRKQLSEIFT